MAAFFIFAGAKSGERRMLLDLLGWKTIVNFLSRTAKLKLADVADQPGA
jgi:hypothetical protein